MKKILPILLIVVILVVAMTACVEKDPGKTEPYEFKTYTVMTPDGAPSMAIAYMMKNNATFSAVGDYRIIGSEAVAASFTNGDADFIIAPTNVGVKMAIKFDYKLLGITSWGNLGIVTSDASLKSRSECTSIQEFMAQFEGKEIASIGTNAVPDVTFKHLLSTANVNATMTASTAPLIQSGLKDGTISIGILGEPAVSATLKSVSGTKKLCTIAYIWAELTGLDFPQAGVFVKSSIIENDINAVNSFALVLDDSIKYLNESAEHAEELGAYMESTGNSTLKAATVKMSYTYMSQSFVPAKSCKLSVINFVKVLGVDFNEETDSDIFYEDLIIA